MGFTKLKMDPSQRLKPLWEWGMQALSLAYILLWHAQLQVFSPAALRNVLSIRASSGFIEMAAGVQEGEVYLMPMELENSNPHKIKTSLNLGHISVFMCMFLLTYRSVQLCCWIKESYREMKKTSNRKIIHVTVKSDNSLPCRNGPRSVGTDWFLKSTTRHSGVEADWMCKNMSASKIVPYSH